MRKIEKSIELGGRTLTISTGHLAQQATSAVLASYGESVVLATVVSRPLLTDLGYFPLSVEYQERLYAGGRIKGSRWVKREGRPTDEEILSARLIDRSIRPLFPEDYKKEVQIIITVLSVDLENSPDVISTVAASAALAISNIPWDGPVGVVRVGMKDSELIVNPTESEIKNSKLDLVVSSKEDAILMLEAGAFQVPEEDILRGIEFAKEQAKKITALIKELASEVNPKKEKIEKEIFPLSLQNKVEKLAEGIDNLIPQLASKEEGLEALDELRRSVVESFEEDEKEKVAKFFDKLLKKRVRDLILLGKRPDSRKPEDIRELFCQVSVLPRTHGSAIFQRGQTQALSIVTLGAPSLEQLIETAAGEETKRFIHHYSMPPYSIGETGKIGFPSRREIGHGALAERALLPVIPEEEEFPYTIRVVTEILSSNGSTSMASVCGSTLSLMDAGVPIKAPIAGIAMGLVVENARHVILTDIVGVEDANGDMDFKVAGSKEGITALQLDVKTQRLTLPILKEALERAKDARLKILDVMLKTLDKPRESVSKYAPKIKIIRINPEKIGDLIGPGGKTIRKILNETGSQIDIDEDGTVYVSGTTHEVLTEAIRRIEAITRIPVPGEIYDGVVKRVQPFGVFVEIAPGKEGLVHVSDMSEGYVKDPSEILKVGDKVQVRLKEVDELGRLNFSMVLDPGFDAQKKHKGGLRREGHRDFKRSSSKPRTAGPHFPRSRLLGEIKRK